MATRGGTYAFNASCSAIGQQRSVAYYNAVLRLPFACQTFNLQGVPWQRRIGDSTMVIPSYSRIDGVQVKPLVVLDKRGW